LRMSFGAMLLRLREAWDRLVRTKCEIEAQALSRFGSWVRREEAVRRATKHDL
jgi:hypothetical protein